jgi:hypothetical protein
MFLLKKHTQDGRFRHHDTLGLFKKSVSWWRFKTYDSGENELVRNKIRAEQCDNGREIRRTDNWYSRRMAMSQGHQPIRKISC